MKKNLGEPVDTPATILSRACDLKLKLLAKDARHGASHTVRLPTGRFHHLRYRRAFWLAKKTGQDFLGPDPSLHGSRPRRLLSMLGYCRVASFNSSAPSICRSERQGNAVSGMAPHAVGVAGWHFLDQASGKQALAHVAHCSAFQGRYNRKDAVVIPRTSRLKDASLCFGKLADHRLVSSASRSLDRLRSHEVKPQKRGGERLNRSLIQACSDRLLMQVLAEQVP